MYLTEEEQKMLTGSRGEGVRTAMEVLVQMSRLYGAERLLPVWRAHIDAAAYTTIWDGGSDFVEYLADHGARCAIPTTINPLSRDIKNWRKLGASEDFAEKSRRIEEAYLRMGVIPTWTCAPYQCVNVPVFGEIVSWSESNAVGYVNSVLGARAERLPDLMDVCCAVTGRVPAYGRYLDENRCGDVLFRLEGFGTDRFHDPSDYALLGYFAGEAVTNRVPVIEGLPLDTSDDDFKALAAAAASGGAVSLFHAVGLTPEAPDLEAAFHGSDSYETIIVTPDDLDGLRDRLSTAKGNRADMVLLGCPHLSATELSTVAGLIKEHHVAAGTELWLMTNETQYALSCRNGDAVILEEAGAVITRDTCLMELDEGDGRFTGKNVVTNSGKAAQYSPSINGTRIYLTDTISCIEAAITGKIRRKA